MIDRALGALLGTLVGDALGRPFEGTPRSDQPRLRRALDLRIASPRAWGHSDDGEMMLGVARSVVAIGRVDEGHILSSLAAGYEPARGYGRGTRATFSCWERTGSWQQASRAFWPEGSRGCGAAVRVAAIALLVRDAREVIIADTAMRSARPTHAHEEGIAGAVAITAALAAALRGEPPSSCVERAIASVPGPFAQSIASAVALSDHDASVGLATGILAVEAVPAALWAFSRGGSFADVVTRAIALGGDTDSIGAMSGALAGGALGGRAIPSAWLDALESPARDEAVALASGLCDPVSSTPTCSAKAQTGSGR